ncbi:MAG TPA: hypothetical protein VHC91_20185 [Trinickia sp.]|uniref:hypothetical protein n=1 Tax=Trinickia sp. TaxID=2571163 RepID=UPI002B94FDE7|nr:hypothetical protein [Trinickia sp.]HVW52680.1 hypothetical protein [Trinickia sp.]
MGRLSSTLHAMLRVDGLDQRANPTIPNQLVSALVHYFPLSLIINKGFTSGQRHAMPRAPRHGLIKVNAGAVIIGS